MGTGHLVMGELTDYLTGEVLPDTHDERLRQEIATFLVNEKGFAKHEIKARNTISVEVDGDSGTVQIDFAVSTDNTILLILLYRPGSLVTRMRPTLAAARLFTSHTVPVSVITNGKDAIVMDSVSGAVIGNGMQAIPHRSKLCKRIEEKPLPKLPAKDRLDREKRILYTMEVLTEKECDDFTCSI